jgi:uncharacterized membrane protein
MVTPPARRLVHGIDLGRVEEAIRAAERRTSSEIRVAIARTYFWGDITRAAKRVFSRLRMDRTAARNGVLLFVAPRRHRFVLWGDAAVDHKVTQKVWDEIAAVIGADFRRGQLTDGIVRGVQALGERLASLFPFDPQVDRNELPDQVVLPGQTPRS